MGWVVGFALRLLYTWERTAVESETNRVIRNLYFQSDQMMDNEMRRKVCSSVGETLPQSCRHRRNAWNKILSCWISKMWWTFVKSRRGKKFSSCQTKSDITVAGLKWSRFRPKSWCEIDKNHTREWITQNSANGSKTKRNRRVYGCEQNELIC